MFYGLFSAMLGENSPDSDDELFNIRLSIINNIKMIIESQQPILDIPEAYPRAKESIMRYGMPASLLNNRQYDIEQLCKELEGLISKFEPRMKQVSVIILELLESCNSIRIHIEGVILSKAEKAPLAINSTIHLSDIRFTVDW
ncbi:GPW/gp25 family protein [Candidatus Sororendozoicomonas aggregata]|uniref:GPW/gp25 family protein n=1 Tax=Candidatus Sororendozoicomonas aggregata TaxID=3073239 RepID=UPI002ED651AB